MSMVRVRLLQQMSGTRNGVPWPEWGAEMEVTAEEAESLCSGQTPIAEYVNSAEPEAAEDDQAPESPVNAPDGGGGAPANASAAEAPKPRTATATKPRTTRAAGSTK